MQPLAGSNVIVTVLVPILEDLMLPFFSLQMVPLSCGVHPSLQKHWHPAADHCRCLRRPPSLCLRRFVRVRGGDHLPKRRLSPGALGASDVERGGEGGGYHLDWGGVLGARSPRAYMAARVYTPNGTGKPNSPGSHSASLVTERASSRASTSSDFRSSGLWSILSMRLSFSA